MVQITEKIPILPLDSAGNRMRQCGSRKEPREVRWPGPGHGAGEQPRWARTPVSQLSIPNALFLFSMDVNELLQLISERERSSHALPRVRPEWSTEAGPMAAIAGRQAHEPWAGPSTVTHCWPGASPETQPPVTGRCAAGAAGTRGPLPWDGRVIFSGTPLSSGLGLLGVCRARRAWVALGPARRVSPGAGGTSEAMWGLHSPRQPPACSPDPRSAGMGVGLVQPPRRHGHGGLGPVS